MENKERLLSLDVLRGLGMLLLTVVGPLFWAANKAWKMPGAVQLQFRHAPWDGFTLWDAVMPLFIFACGAAVPYALAKRLDEDGWATGAFWKHVLGRFALLVLGGVLLGAGWGLALAVPCIKHVYTVSFSCQAMGWCVLALALLFVLTDVLRLRRGWWLFTLFGQCALTAYMATHFFRPALDACVKTLTQGLPRYVDRPYMPLAETLVTCLVLTAVLVLRRRLRGVRPAEPDEPGEEAQGQAPDAPAFRSQLMDGAIADRFKIPGVGEHAATPGHAGESTSQAAHVKTKLKLHA